MYNIFNINMDAGFIIILIFIFGMGVGTYLYMCGECCESHPEEQEREDISCSSSETTVRVTSPIH